jgi:hypothetical protein
MSLLVALMFLVSPMAAMAGEEAHEEPLRSNDGPDAMSRATKATSYLTEDATFLRIGNEHFELGFNKTAGVGLDEIIDKSTGLDLRSDKVAPPLLFMIFYWNGTGIALGLNWDTPTIAISTETGADFARATVTFTNISGYNINVTFVVTVKDGERLAKMRLAVQNDEAFVIKSVIFPIVWGLGQIGQQHDDDAVFFPMGDGVLLHDPLSDLSGLYLSGKYPGDASIQLMLHYDKDEAGLYMATQDTEGYPKELQLAAMEWAATDHMVALDRLFVPEYEGNDLTMDYDAVIGTFNGDWYKAAAMYKEWAETTPFVSGGKVFEDKDVPEWFRNTSIIQMVNRDDPDVEIQSLDTIVSVTKAFSDMTGLNTTVMIHGWEGNGAWVGPYYYPPAEGETVFEDAMGSLADDGNRGFTYISGSVWRITREDIGYADHDLFNSTGLAWVALNETGEPTYDPFYESLGWHSARMDPMTDFWHDMVVDNALESVRLGVQVVQVDEFPIGTIYPCYNSSHGHPAGYSKNISAAFRSILTDIRTDGRAMDPDFVMSMEEPSEFYLPYMDTYVSRDNAPEALLYGGFVDQHGDNAEFIPFFSYVYHEHVTSFGEHLQMATSYPIEFYDSIARGLGRTFIQGEIQNAIGSPEGDMRPGLVELYDHTAVATATYGNRYLIEGEPLVPVDIDVPDEEVRWYNYFQGAEGTPVHEPVVLNSAWRADDGDVALAFVNWDRSTHEFDVEVPQYDLPEGNHTILLTRNGEVEVAVPRTELPVSITLTLEENDVVLLEVTDMADLSVDDDDLGLDVGTLLTNEEVLVNLTVQNTGTLDAGPFEVSFFMNGSGMSQPEQFGDDQEVPALAVDQEVTVGVLWNTTGLLGEYDLSALVDVTGNVTEIFESNNTALRNVTVEPRPRSDILVRVVDNGTDAPLNDTSLELWQYFGIDPVYVTQNRTNASGGAGFYQVVKGIYQLRAEREGYHPSNISFDVPEGEVVDVEARMDMIPLPPPPPETLVYGFVVDNSTNIRINEANVTIFDLDDQSVVAYAVTNITGEYSITNVSAGNYTITASKYGYFVLPLNLTIPFNYSHVRVDFELVPDIPAPTTGNLTGYITDRETGDPIAGAYVMTYNPYVMVQTDDDGLYLIRDLNEGIYLLMAWMDGYVTETRDVSIVAGMTKTLNITLGKEPGPPPPPTITGNVTDEGGNPIAGARVVRINSPNPFNGTTDENGYFRFENISVGTYVFRVHADGYISALSIPVTVTWNETKSVNITLKKMDEPKPPDNDGIILAGLAGDIVMVLLVSLVFVVVILIAYVLGKRFRKGKGPKPEEEKEEAEGTLDKDEKVPEETAGASTTPVEAPATEEKGPEGDEGPVERDDAEE